MNFTDADRARGRSTMETKLTPAARVRRQFRSGRPIRREEFLHRFEVWKRTQSLISDFRQRLETAEGTSPDDFTAWIVGVREANPAKPILITAYEEEKAMKALSAPDIIGVGLVFLQFDPQAEHKDTKEKGVYVSFPVQFSGLSEPGVALMRKAAEEVLSAAKKLWPRN